MTSMDLRVVAEVGQHPIFDFEEVIGYVLPTQIECLTDARV
jgi:hypothetical protein